MEPGLDSDGQIFDWITNGISSLGMPAFGEVIEEEDRWHLINYIRTFAEEHE